MKNHPETTRACISPVAIAAALLLMLLAALILSIRHVRRKREVAE